MKKLTLITALLIAGVMGYAGSDEAFVYPNPALDQMYVQIPDNFTGITVLTIVDLSGREVYRAERSLDELEFRKTLIPVADLANGTYILRITDGTHQTGSKFIKE